MPPETRSSRSPVGYGQTAGTSSAPVREPPVLSQLFQRDIDDLRGLIQCVICLRPLYEPFTLECGHTFCYSCLTQWFNNHRGRETCPHCRTTVNSKPAPAYLLRSMVHIFINRGALLENGETTAEHLENQRAETEKIEKDKKSADPATGGLFQGCFQRSRLPAPVYDPSDGVDRCPDCAWELEYGECVNCGFSIDVMSTSYFDSVNGDPIDDNNGDDRFDFLRTPSPSSHLAIVSTPERWLDHVNRSPDVATNDITADLSSRSSSREDYDSDEMDSFIDDDMDRDLSEVSEQATVVGSGGYVPRQPSFSPPSGMPDHPTMSLTDDGLGSVSSGDEDDDDDDDEPIRGPGRSYQFRGRTTRQPPTQPNQPCTSRSSHRQGSPQHLSGATAGETINIDDDSESPRRPSRPRRALPDVFLRR